MRRRVTSFILLVGVSLFVFATMFAGDCTNQDRNKTAQQQRDQSIDQRLASFSRAASKYPNPVPENFPMRDALVKFTERQDLINHPWYIYVLGQNGNAINYFVGQTYPQSICNFLSSTEEIRDDESGNLVLSAPSFDGIYYGGSGTSAGCDAYFTFDQTTDAMIVIKGSNWYATDQPLLLNVEPVVIQGGE